MRFAEFLLALALVGSILIGRTFSYLQIGPLFVTDAIFFALLALCTLLRPGWLFARGRVERLILAYVAIAAIHTATALSDRGESALRDATLAGYALFALLVPAIVSRWKQLWRLVALGLGAAVLLAATVAPHPEVLGGTTGFFLGAAAVALLGGFAIRFRAAWAVLIAGLGIEIALSGSRATAVGCMAGAAGLFLSVGAPVRRRVVVGFAAACCCGLLLTLLAADSPAAAKRLRAGKARFVSGTVGYRSDGTAQWRLETWGNALRLIAKHPVTGVGFGAPVMVYAVEEPSEKIESPYNYGLPHNTFLTVALRMGLPGLALLAAILGSWAYRMWRLRAYTPAAASILAVAVYACCYGFFSLLFERPFMAMPFWSVVGLGLSLERQTLRTSE